MTTVRQICTFAFGELQYFAEGETPSAGAMSEAVAALNRMIAMWRVDGLLIFWPSGNNWRGPWDTNIVYAVNDAVWRSGSMYVCSAAHTSTQFDRPGTSPNWASYWTVYRETALALNDTFPLGPEFEKGVTSMLAVEVGKFMNVPVDDQTRRDARAGETALFAAFLPINPVGVDPGLVRMPSQIWPYTTDPTTTP